MRILIVYGTRPEFLKVYPLIRELLKIDNILLSVINTGQHRDMVLELESFFNYSADIYLNVMTEGQSLNSIVSKIVLACDHLFDELKPDFVLIQGDTTTVMSTALAAFNKSIKICHLEAGLRSRNINSPFPEEFNRRTVSLISNINFAPTENAKTNLIQDGVKAETIYVTGNTIIDTLKLVKKRLLTKVEDNKVHILVTAHRRENHKVGIKHICNAIRDILSIYENVWVTWPVHPNPHVKDIVYKELGQIDRVSLIKPVNYLSLLELINNSHIIWTDSGGIQEEAPEFNKPVLILREETERPELITCGLGFLVGTNEALIKEKTIQILDDKQYFDSLKTVINPFGDGMASIKIAKILAGLE